MRLILQRVSVRPSVRTYVRPSARVVGENHYFFVIFAVPGMSCILLGTIFSVPYTLPIGLGITIYGAAYFFVHEIFIHQRFKVLRNTNIKYFKAIRRAHKVHHKHLKKEDGECFGMLWVPLKYFSQK